MIAPLSHTIEHDVIRHILYVSIEMLSIYVTIIQDDINQFAFKYLHHHINGRCMHTKIYKIQDLHNAFPAILSPIAFCHGSVICFT